MDLQEMNCTTCELGERLSPQPKEKHRKSRVSHMLAKENLGSMGGGGQAAREAAQAWLWLHWQPTAEGWT